MDRRGGEGAVLSGIVRSVGETGSTNADMLGLAAAGEPEGAWLRADRQYGGRGRLGREWASPLGNLYTSTIVRLRSDDPPAATLALASAVALEEVIGPMIAGAVLPRPVYELHAAGRPAERVQLKWPNDLLIAGAKLSGILLERSGDAVVIGIGVNVTDHPVGLGRATTSLAAQGVTITPAALLDLLIPAFARWIGIWRLGLVEVLARWLSRAHPIGTPISATTPDGQPLAGTFAGLAPDGALLLREAGGGTRILHAAEVFLV